MEQSIISTAMNVQPAKLGLDQENIIQIRRTVNNNCKDKNLIAQKTYFKNIQ